MSIHQINKLFQNKGCNIAISVILGISVISMLGVGTRGCGKDNQQDARSAQYQQAPIVTAGELKITRGMIENAVEQQMQQYKQFESMLPPDFRVKDITAGVLNMGIANGLALKVARQEGIEFSDSAIRQRRIDGQLQNIRMQLEQQGKLMPNASQQEFENAFKAATNGQSLPTFRADLEKALDEQLNSEDGKLSLYAEEAFPLLVEKHKAKHMPTEEAVKAQFDTYRFKVIDITPDKAGPQGPNAKAQQVLKEIKAGLSFEAAMDKYSGRLTTKGKKPSDEKPQELLKDTLADSASTKPLLSLKPGEVSEVITTPSGGTAIYKFLSHSIELPKDYATKKATLIDTKAKDSASKALGEQIKKLDTPENVKWSSEGYHVLHDFSILTSGQEPAAPDQPKKLREIIERALKNTTDPLGGEVAAVAAKAAMDKVIVGLSPTEAAKLKVQVLSAYVEKFREVAVKTELADAYVTLGDAEHALPSLTDAAEANSIHTDEKGTANWTTINRAIKTAVTKKLITPEDEKNLNKFYTQWVKDYAEQQTLARQEEDRRKREQAELEKINKEPAPTPTPAPNKPAPKKTPGKP